MKREASEDVAATVSAILREVEARGDAALIDYTRRFDKLELTQATLRVGEDEIEAAVARLPEGGARGARLRQGAHRGLPSPPTAEGRSFHRCGRHRPWPALDADRRGRPLRAGRHGELPLLRADERGAGEDRRRAAHRHGGADAGGPQQSAGARRGEARRHRRDLPRRRARRRSRRSPSAPRRSRPSPRSPDPAMPMWRRRSGTCSGGSASIRSRALRKC